MGRYRTVFSVVLCAAVVWLGGFASSAVLAGQIAAREDGLLAARQDGLREWKQLVDEARRARAAENWAGAHRSYALALEQARSLENGHSQIAETLELQVSAYTATRESERALEVQLLLVEHLEAGPRARSIDAARALFRLGNLYNQLGPYSEAESAFRRALEIRDGIDGTAYPQPTSIVRSLESVLAKLRPDDEEREALLQRNLRLAPKPHHHLVLGNYYASLELHDPAIEQYRLGLALEDQSPAPSRERRVSFLVGLARQAQALGRVDEAESLFREALQLREELKGEDHPYLASLLRRLGSMYIEEGRFHEAEVELERALALDQAAWGDHPHECSCDVRHLLVEVYEALGRQEALGRLEGHRHEAEPRGLADDPAAAPIRFVERDAAERQGRGEFAEAVELARESLDMRERLYGHDSIEVVEGLARLGELLGKRSRYDEAMEQYRRGLELLRASEDAETRRLVELLRGAGSLARRAGMDADAERYLSEELELREQLGQRMRAAWVLQTLSGLHRSAGAHGEARADLDRMIELWTEIAGESAPEILNAKISLGRVYVDEGRLAEAEELTAQVLDRVEADPDAEPGQLLPPLRLMQDILNRAGRRDEAAQLQTRIQELNELLR